MKKDEFIGKGWFFPVGFRDDAAILDIAQCNQDILQSLKILFTTLPGERIAHPLFGCDLQQFMFSSINNSLLANIKQTVITAVTLFETRIQVLEVVTQACADEANTLEINIYYQLNHTNSRYNMVIPFNLIDGLQFS